MMVALLVLAFASLVFWLVFFQFKLIRLTPGWGVIFGFFVVHLLLVFVIGLRFITPNSANATVVQRTIQLVPRLPEPTLVEEVLVKEGAAVKKGQPLFQFDRRPYQYKVDQISAQLAAAKQNVNVLKADVDAAAQGAKKAKVELEYRAVSEADLRQAGAGAGRTRGGRGTVADPGECSGSNQQCGIGSTRKSHVCNTNPRLTASTQQSPTWSPNFSWRDTIWIIPL